MGGRGGVGDREGRGVVVVGFVESRGPEYVRAVEEAPVQRCCVAKRFPAARRRREKGWR